MLSLCLDYTMLSLKLPMHAMQAFYQLSDIPRCQTPNAIPPSLLFLSSYLLFPGWVGMEPRALACQTRALPLSYAPFPLSVLDGGAWFSPFPELWTPMPPPLPTASIIHSALDLRLASLGLFPSAHRQDHILS